MPAESLLLLGEQQLGYGNPLETVGEDCAGAISVGASKDTPSLEFKGDPAVPNEDALLVIDAGHLCLLAVADAHFGRAASHLLITRLSDVCEPLPRDAAELADRIDTLDFPTSVPPEVNARCGTTLLVSIVDREARQVFGLCYGDSSLVVLGGGIARRAHAANTRFIKPWRAGSLAAARATAFAVSYEPGSLLVAFTDGINECCYRQPERSIGEAHLAALYLETGAEPATYADRLVQLALEGVGGNPGGQDNIAVVVARG